MPIRARSLWPSGPRPLVALVLVLSLAVACSGQADRLAAGEAANVESAAGSGAVEPPALPLLISPDDYDFSKSPGLLKRITGSPHGYFRFISQKFAQAVCRRFAGDLDIMGVVNLHGDAHLENYIVTDRQRGLADFDDATAGPFVLDLVRFGVSIRLASMAMGWEDKADAVVDTFLTGYRSGLRYEELYVPEPAIVDRIRISFPRDRAKILAAAEALMIPIDMGGQEFKRATRRYLEDMTAENPHLPPGFFEIKRMGSLNLGIGSALSKKFLMRVEGPSPSPLDDVILEAKEVGDLKGIDCIQRSGAEVGRVAVAQARLAFERPRYYGYVIMHPRLGFDRRDKFWVFAWDDNYAELSIVRSFLTPEDLFDVARDVGIQLGRGHPRSIADPYETMLRRGLLLTLSDIQPEIELAIREMTPQVIAAWERFRDEVSTADRPATSNPGSALAAD